MIATPPGFRRGLCAGFGDPIPADRRAALAALRFDLVRTSIQKADRRAAVVAAIRAAGLLQGLYLVASADDLAAVPPDGWVELGNEPELGDAGLGLPPMSAAAYAAWARPLLAEAQARGLRAYCGAISEIAPARLAWLHDVLGLLPAFERVAVHRYPRGDDQRPEASAWPSRTVERAALGYALRGRRFLVSETGNRAATYWDWVPPWRHRVDEARRLPLLQREVACWTGDTQCDGVAIYQEWAGSAGTDPYGVRGPDWTWRPAGRVWI